MKKQNTFDKIYDVVKLIPKGTVASYGQVAELAGNRRWSRVVGYALNACPDTPDLPCHRVVTRDGAVSAAFASDSGNRQIELLINEGVEFTDGRVDMKNFQWKKRIF